MDSHLSRVISLISRWSWSMSAICEYSPMLALQMRSQMQQAKSIGEMSESS